MVCATRRFSPAVPPRAVALVLLLSGVACNLKPAGNSDGGPDAGVAGAPGDEDGGFPFDLPSFTTGGTGGSVTGSGGAGGRGGSGTPISAGTGGSATGGGGSSGTGGQPGGTMPDAGRADVAVEAGPPPVTTPSATWQETWYEHVEPLGLVSHDGHAVIYADNAVVRTSAAWVQPFSSKVWQYIKTTYGAFGSDPRVYVVTHQGTRYPGGHAAGYQDAHHGNRNVFDVNQATWTQSQPAMNLIVRQAASIAESHNNGIRGSAGFSLWGFKLGDLFEYDIYMGLGMTAEAQATHDRLLLASDSSPRAGSYWFRDWHLPIWMTHGRSQVLAKFFRLLAQHYPTVAEGTGRRYARSLNHGEYVHFMSGAAGTSLKTLATQAFGWTAEMEAQFSKARTDFPAVTY